jgi:eukaryotic-like serine/threonine-protein kinase
VSTERQCSIVRKVCDRTGTTSKSDIWALGITLFRLLHGQVWYKEAPRPSDLIKAGGFADSLKWLPHIPKGWRTVIRKMLNDSTADRYQNANQVLSAIALLPVEPIWTANVNDDTVRWEQTKGQRRLLVEWKRISQRKHQWEAWSEPLGKGRTRKLGGSVGIIGYSQVLSELRRFFGA